jgi:hypothetical protein
MLPSAGFEYEEASLHALLQTDVATLLELHPGCASRPLEVVDNSAGGMGGGMFIGDCDESSQRSGFCSIFSSKADLLSAMRVRRAEEKELAQDRILERAGE